MSIFYESPAALISFVHIYLFFKLFGNIIVLSFLEKALREYFTGIIFCFVLLFSGTAGAAVSEFASYFEVDLEKDPLPKMEELEEVFIKNEDYNRKYDSLYDLLGEFDREFYVKLATYGSAEKRFKDEDEDAFLEMLSLMDKKYYQYIGPSLFEVPDMSEKILNLPGIKETKNKFPTRIAEEVKDIEDLEFMSPALYFMLMPEYWPSYKAEIEKPVFTPYFPQVKYDKDFYAMIKKLVKPEKFMPNYQEKSTKSKSDLRTLYPEKDSLLTSADIKAFIATIDAVNAWTIKLENAFWIAKISSLWGLYEKEDTSKFVIPYAFKDFVNPCARLVQKARIQGKELELARLVAPQGFTLNEWAYTCDKTIRAFRVANVKSGVVQAIREYQRGIYDDEIRGLSSYTQNVRFATMQMIIQAHKAPLSDVLEYKKNRKDFEQTLKRNRFLFLGYPLFHF